MSTDPKSIRPFKTGPVKPKPALSPQSAKRAEPIPERMGGLSLTSDRARAHLVAKLKSMGIADSRVLDVMATVPRHLFVDEAFASRCYEDAALPIGHQQTISKPSTVARFAEYALQGRSSFNSVLEVGGGCGYQAAVFAALFKRVVSIERIEALYHKGKKNLAAASITNATMVHGDGLVGYPSEAPFDIIIVAAAGLDIPEALLQQLKIGGRLIVPVHDNQQQVLVTMDRTSSTQWTRQNKDLVKFVPLVKGTRPF